MSFRSKRRSKRRSRIPVLVRSFFRGDALTGDYCGEIYASRPGVGDSIGNADQTLPATMLERRYGWNRKYPMAFRLPGVVAFLEMGAHTDGATRRDYLRRDYLRRALAEAVESTGVDCVEVRVGYWSESLSVVFGGVCQSPPDPSSAALFDDATLRHLAVEAHREHRILPSYIRGINRLRSAAGLLPLPVDDDAAVCLVNYMAMWAVLYDLK